MDANSPNTRADDLLVSPDAISDALQSEGYIPTTDIAMAVYLGHQLRKPLLIEGPAGVGKTDLARALSEALSAPLIRLQCYEGLDSAKALYEWKYAKQLLYTQILKDKVSEVLGDVDLDGATGQLEQFDDVFFSEAFLEPRALLRAMRQDDVSVLLIDEVDKADEAFEAFLLEVLADYQVTVPELGTITARTPPIVILTSNAVRELTDALKRRCLHLHIGFPEAAREEAIVTARVPGIETDLTNQLVAFVQSLRGLDLRKHPSIAETVDWARALVLLHTNSLDEQTVRSTLNLLLKYESDIAAAAPILGKIVREAAPPARP
ncbi:MAG: MoxR family ATPase [Pseudomonadota bacterium]